MNGFHEQLMNHVSLNALQEPEPEEVFYQNCPFALFSLNIYFFALNIYIP